MNSVSWLLRSGRVWPIQVLLLESVLPLFLTTSVEWAAIAYGANGIGAAYTAMYTHQHGDEWAYILNDSTPSMLAVANTAILDKLVKHLPSDAADMASMRCNPSR